MVYSLSEDEKKYIINEYNNVKCSHVLICMNKYSGNIFPWYITYDEDIIKIIEQCNYRESEIDILEIYNYNYDIEYQLKHNKAYFITPIIDKKCISEESLRALGYANKKHEGQTRKDNTPYIMHPIRVAKYVSQYKESKELPMLISCAYLHDTLEDTDSTYYDLCANFGPEVAHIVKEVTTEENMKNSLGKEKYLSYKMESMTSWALVVKLCDRLDNVTDLATSDEKFRIKYMNETIGILDYLVKNRTDLTKTHLKIMNDIMDTLIFYNQYFNYSDDRMYHLQDDVTIRKTIKEKEYSLS